MPPPGCKEMSVTSSRMANRASCCPSVSSRLRLTLRASSSASTRKPRPRPAPLPSSSLSSTPICTRALAIARSRPGASAAAGGAGIAGGDSRRTKAMSAATVQLIRHVRSGGQVLKLDEWPALGRPALTRCSPCELDRVGIQKASTPCARVAQPVLHAKCAKTESEAPLERLLLCIELDGARV
eukprot:scaffold22545_cov126-Isochrysis_galbana.AAC.1